MKLIELLEPPSPPPARGARVVTFGTAIGPDTEERQKARSRWREMKAEWNRRRKERGWRK